MTKDNEQRATFDPATVLAIGIVVYLIDNVMHEGVGHGGTCLLVGCHPIGISSAWWRGSYEGASEWAPRAISAGGTLANLALGLACVPVWKALEDSRRSHLRLFVWLLLVVNLFTGGGYMLADPIGNFGDWSAFLEGLRPNAPIRVGIVATGLAISLATAHFATRSIEAFLGVDEHERIWRVRWLCWGPYVLGGIVFTLAGLLNAGGPAYAVTSALATFGGGAFLAWIPTRSLVSDQQATLRLGRSPGWLVAGVASLVFIVGVLGPGISFER